MPDTTAGQSGPASTTIADTAAERTRVREIYALCREHQVDDANFADSLVERGVSTDAAAREILTLKKAEIKANRPAHSVHSMTDRAADRPFSNIGEQLVAIAKFDSGVGSVDPRLKRQAAASGMSEGVPSDGGFAIQPDFSAEIIKRAYELGAILSRVRKVPISAGSNGLKINALDEVSRVDGSRFGGIQTFWANEADTATAKKPKMRQMELALRKLIGLWYVTDELIADSTALSAVASDAFSQEITFMVENAIVNGTGVGQPAGFLNAPTTVQVAKEAAQATLTLNTANLAKMYGRMYAPSRANAVWLINQDVEQALYQLTLGGTTTSFPAYLPPGGFSQAPFATIFGKPVVPVEYCQSFTTAGDIIFADLSQYLLIDKGGPEQAQSIHVRFINDETTFRITYRVDGQPIWNSALTPKNGTNTLAPFIKLQSR